MLGIAPTSNRTLLIDGNDVCEAELRDEPTGVHRLQQFAEAILDLDSFDDEMQNRHLSSLRAGAIRVDVRLPH